MHLLRIITTDRPIRGGNCVVRTDQHGNDVFSYWVNRRKQELSFAKTPPGRRSAMLDGNDWVPVTAMLPIKVAPRAEVPDGVLADLGIYFDLFHPSHAVVH